VANLFNHHPGLAPLSETEMGKLDDKLFSSQGSREARAFALWMNSLGVEPFINSLFDDLRDGRILLQVIDHIRPNSVAWKRVNKAEKLSRFKAIENTNYVVDIAKDWKFSLVGIQGADITDGSSTLTLGLVWQLMREHILTTLARLTNQATGQTVKEQDILDWANGLVKGAHISQHSAARQISSFKDPSLKSGLFLIDLLAAMKQGIVNRELCTSGVTEVEAKMNGKYAISIARKLGATIFLLPEDVWEVKPKMLLALFGTLMVVYRGWGRE
jgi:plastin-1